MQSIHGTVKCLETNNANLMDGAIKCLDMFASGENLSDQHLPRLIPLLFPHLLRIFSAVWPVGAFMLHLRV